MNTIADRLAATSLYELERQYFNRIIRDAIANRQRLFDLAFSCHRDFSMETTRASELVMKAWSEAETHLVRMVLSTDPKIPFKHYAEAEMINAPTRGLLVDGLLYLATPQDPDANDGEPPDYTLGRHKAMELRIIDMANVLDLEDDRGLGRMDEVLTESREQWVIDRAVASYLECLSHMDQAMPSNNKEAVQDSFHHAEAHLINVLQCYEQGCTMAELNTLGHDYVFCTIRHSGFDLICAPIEDGSGARLIAVEV